MFSYVPALLLLFVAGVTGLETGIPVDHFLRDTTAVAHVPFYTGALSNIGIFLWCAAASVCFLTSSVLHTVARSSKAAPFFLSAGFLTLVLMLDDAFLVHEVVAPDYLGVADNVVFIIYGVMVATFFLRHKSFIYGSDYALLFMCLGFFAASVATDKLHDFGLLSLWGVRSQGVQFFLEDGFKLLGIAGWLGYFALSGYAQLTQRLRAKTTATQPGGAAERFVEVAGETA